MPSQPTPLDRALEDALALHLGLGAICRGQESEEAFALLIQTAERLRATLEQIGHANAVYADWDRFAFPQRAGTHIDRCGDGPVC